MIEISLIIPAHNEAKLLPRLLDSVEAARLRFHGGAEAVEIIVADDASTDGTAELAAARGCTVVPVGKRRIACARNGGAGAARGRILCFVDADMQIHPESFNAIHAVMERRDVIAGATGVRPERWSAGIAATFAAFMPLVWASGFDTGIVCCRREDFDAVGGYEEHRELGEDLAFLWALWRLGRKRGQSLLRLSGAKAIVSMRKFDQYGDWHYFTKILPQCLPSLLNPSRRAEFAARYWYGNDR
jgi:glycosyltransferase involved in cell wall biosynthesis